MGGVSPLKLLGHDAMRRVRPVELLYPVGRMCRCLQLLSQLLLHVRDRLLCIDRPLG